MDKLFSILNGNEIKAFIKHIPIIYDFVQSKFPRDRNLKTFCSALKIWHDIQPFLHITVIKNISHYPAQIYEFEKQVTEFYEHSAKTFLTGTIIGDYETFYTHTLRYYLPVIARSTFHDYKVWIGIFTIQGFERRNKESKNTLRRFSNGKRNVLNNNLSRLHDVFEYEMTNV